MASLTPGVLSKLLENVGDIHAKVTGEHRSALLQVIGIVPALVGGDDADPWRSHGFFLRVSDSVHSAYVSISEADIDLILSDKIQLGQFIYVSRLDSASPVPVLRGLKPVPKRRPCIGEPKDLISSDSLTVRTKTDFSSAKKSAAKVVKPDGYKKAEAKALAMVKPRKSVTEEPKTARRLSVDIGRIEGLELRRLSLDSPRRGWDQSPRSKSSPRAVPKGNSRDGSCSSRTPPEVCPSRRKASEKDLAVKRPKSPTLSVSPLTNKNQNISQKSSSKNSGKESKPSPDTTPPPHLTKVPVSFKSWSDRKVSWDSLPRAIHDLGKETTGNRNLAFLAAVQAMEEASASDRVIQCMSMFAELCQSAQKDSAGQVVAQFLELHQAIQKAAANTNALLNTTTQQRNISPYPKYPLVDICEDIPNKNALSWVLAAVETNLSGFSLYRKGDHKEVSNEERSHFIVLENPLKKTEPENNSPQSKRGPVNVPKGPSPSRKFSAPPKKLEPERKEWVRGNGLKDASVLAEKLLVMSRVWFLNYFEDSLNKRFDVNSCEGSSDMASLLRQLKRVNQWLDDSVAADESGSDQRIERLRKKLYGFLLEHVDSAIVACK